MTACHFERLQAKTQESQNISNVEGPLHHPGWLQSKTGGVSVIPETYTWRPIWTPPSKLSQQPLQQKYSFHIYKRSNQCCFHYIVKTLLFVWASQSTWHSNIGATNVVSLGRDYLFIQPMTNEAVLGEVFLLLLQFSSLVTPALQKLNTSTCKIRYKQNEIVMTIILWTETLILCLKVLSYDSAEQSLRTTLVSVCKSMAHK